MNENQLKTEIKRLLKSKIFWISVLILFLGLISNYLSAGYIKVKYNTLPVLNDLMLDNLPYFHIVWVYDLINILSIVLFFWYTLKKEVKNIPYFLLIFGILNLLRGAFIALTPFGSPNGFEKGIYGSFVVAAGLYPSGHTGSTFLAFLLAKGRCKKILFGLVIALVVTLLLGKGHYSIDIFSAIIFAYAVYVFGEKHLKKKFFIK